MVSILKSIRYSLDAYFYNWFYYGNAKMGPNHMFIEKSLSTDCMKQRACRDIGRPLVWLGRQSACVFCNSKEVLAWAVQSNKIKIACLIQGQFRITVKGTIIIENLVEPGAVEMVEIILGQKRPGWKRCPIEWYHQMGSKRRTWAIGGETQGLPALYVRWKGNVSGLAILPFYVLKWWRPCRC